ncbi:MAG: hypothetical protein LBE02_03170 [Spirochaetaceae bacterium]|nr:hypothetical protein [Spirochaetaceae bacterium]
MNRPRLFLLFLTLGIVLPRGPFWTGSVLEAQDEEWSNWDIDSLFDAPQETEIVENDNMEPEDTITLRDRVTIEASYDFVGAFSPGWSEAPWEAPWNDEKNKYNYILGARIEALLSLDFNLTESLRVWNSFSFSVPDKTIFSIKEFYFDYNLQRRLYLRAGLFTIAWGISVNFPYTNLPSRVPEKSGGDSYMAKLDIPIGIGGLQLLAMTRNSFLQDPASPKMEEIAYGIKYNLAFEKADIDAGFFYYIEMPLRGFISLKTTLGNTEIYAEGLTAIPHPEMHRDQQTGSSSWGETYDSLRFSGSAGFLQDFFRGKLTVNGEIFFNGEKATGWYRERTEFQDAEALKFIEGFNGALNLIYRPGIIGMRLFVQCLYALDENSAQLVPGISIKPGDLITATLTVPMALGNRDGTYYTQNADRDNRPFSIVLLLSFGSTFKYKM